MAPRRGVGLQQRAAASSLQPGRDSKQLMAIVVEPAADSLLGRRRLRSTMRQGTMEIEPQTMKNGTPYGTSLRDRRVRQPDDDAHAGEGLGRVDAHVESRSSKPASARFRAAEQKNKTSGLRHRRRDLRRVHKLPREVRGRASTAELRRSKPKKFRGSEVPEFRSSCELRTLNRTCEREPRNLGTPELRTSLRSAAAACRNPADSPCGRRARLVELVADRLHRRRVLGFRAP